MILPVSSTGRLLVLAGLLTLSLQACGRRGPLELPPDPAAVAAQRQREEVRRRQGVATAGQTEILPAAETARVEGSPRAPELDDDEDAPGVLPSAVPTRPSGGRRRGPVIPREPFVLDPLL